MNKLSLLAAVFVACTAAPPLVSEEVEDGVAVEAGKEDNFLSQSAKEFVVTGRSTITVAENATDRDVQKLVSLKHIAIAWFLNQYLVDKEEDEANHAFGGFGAMVKTGSYKDLEIKKENPTTYSFKFAQLIAGRNDLLRRLPRNAQNRLVVEIGRPSNEEMAALETNNEWYRKAPWSAWDPAKVETAKKETMLLELAPETESNDAWWDYKRLFEDGKLDIDVYFGWDYHSDYHLKHSKSFYDWLLREKGFHSPVASFDRYTRTSGPLTRTLVANGANIQVEVRILYGKPGTETDPDTDAGGKVLEDEMRDSVKKRDVIVYSGHSGPFYGFALANWKKTNEGDFDDADMVVAEMAKKYQIVLAEGCDTYMIGQAFLNNPAKHGANVDVVTTTSFSNASSPVTVESFFSRLLEIDSASRHRPRTLKSLLDALDGDATDGGFHTMYGIHGIDDNPKVHPYANLDRACQACSTNADCGGPGNSCISIGRSGKRCAAACTDDTGCPDGYACRKVASTSTSTIYSSMCVPANSSCR